MKSTREFYTDLAARGKQELRDAPYAFVDGMEVRPAVLFYNSARIFGFDAAMKHDILQGTREFEKQLASPKRYDERRRVILRNEVWSAVVVERDKELKAIPTEMMYHAQTYLAESKRIEQKWRRIADERVAERVRAELEPRLIRNCGNPTSERPN